MNKLTRMPDGKLNEEFVARLNLGGSATEAEITAEVTRLQAEYDANQYQRDRATAYPSLQDQADMQFHDLANSTTTWLDAIQAVKDAYPKP